MERVLILSILILLSIIVSAQTNSDFIAQDILVDQQKEMLSYLTGMKKFENGKILNDRWSVVNKKRTREYLRREFNKIGLPTEEQKYRWPNIFPMMDLIAGPYEGTNLYVTIPATTKSIEYVILGAHYDTQLENGRGAIDNGCAMAIIFSVAKFVSEMEHRGMNTLIVFFDQEEEDLIGSQAFAALLKADDYKIHSVHTLDQIGWDADGDRNIELELPSPQLEKLYQSHAQQLGFEAIATPVNSTDHHSFRELGFETVGLSEEYVNQDATPYGDTVDDTFDTVNFEYLASTTILVRNVFAELLSN